MANPFNGNKLAGGGKVLPPSPHTAFVGSRPYVNQGAGPGRGIVYPSFVKPDTSTNAYPHQPDNIVTNSVDDNKLSINFQPNILDNYDVVTYHFKLFITTPDASSTGDIFNPATQIIIAESGVTDLTIDKVEIETNMTPSIMSGTGTATSIKFEIVEPSGAGLVDKIFYQSVALGIGNWNVMPIYLQLQFKGRSPTDSEANNGAPGSIGNLRWVWPLKLNDINAIVTNVGTRYEISGIYYNDLALANSKATFQHAIVLENLSTVEDAITKLQDRINEDQYFRLLGPVSLPDTYKFILDPIIAKYNITPSDSNTNSVRNNSTKFFNGKNATFPQGTSIDKIIDSILSQTKEYQNLMTNSKTPGPVSESMNEENSQMKQFWRIVPETRPLKYDQLREDYAREYSYFIIKYDIGVLDADVFQDSANSDTLAAERKRLLTYANKNILRKKYNYIFTGLNDQIINFDIKLNNAYATSINRMHAIYIETAMADKGVVTQTNSNDEASVLEKVTRAIEFQNSSSIVSDKQKQAAITDAMQSISASDINDIDKQRYTVLLNHSKPASRLTLIKQAYNAGGLDINGQLTLASSTAKYNATPLNDKQSQNQLNFISDVDPSSNAAKQAVLDYTKSLKGKLRPVAKTDALQLNQVGMGIEPNSNSGIQKLSSFFATAMSGGSLDTSFASANILIKGDPYWLAPPPITNDGAYLYNSLLGQQGVNRITNTQNIRLDYVNATGSDNFLIVRFRTPRIFNIDENPDTTDPFSDVEMYTAVYKVTYIKHKFETGVFKQELNCIMDYNINLSKFLKEIDANSNNLDIPTNPDELTSQNRFPNTSIKNQRILGKIDIPGIQSNLTAGLTPEEIINGLSVKYKGPTLGSNIPVATPNLLAGLPDNFI